MGWVRRRGKTARDGGRRRVGYRGKRGGERSVPW